MRILSIAITLTEFLMVGCSSVDPTIEIKQLAASGDVMNAKLKFKALVEKEKDPNLERQYIQFLFEHKQYSDFNRQARTFLAEYPEDKDVKNLKFEFFAKLATDAERSKNYSDANYYIVTELTNPEYAGSSRWEKRQTEILRKWYEQAKEEKDEPKQKKVLSEMKNLGFENLARNLDPEVFKTIEDQKETPESEEQN